MKYTHDYSQTLTYKVLNARKPDRVFNTFEQTLDLIRAVHRMTGGLKQIVYLAGWQYDGHDSKYPAWFEGNPRLKRSDDRDAMASLRWLMSAAKEYNALVSLHINMDDAYPNSPLWDEYLAKDLIVRKPDGSLREAGVWDGEMSYNVCKAREWEAGLGQRRIDQLLELLPVREAGSVHIDAFRPADGMAHAGVTYEQEFKTVLDIIGHFRKNGIDVTTEFLAGHELIGQHPMVYHYNASEQTRLAHPASVICGGGSAWNMRRKNLRDKVAWSGAFLVPEAGCLYEEAWGQSVDLDLKDNSDLPRFADDFYLRTVPWHFLNRHRPLALQQTNETYSVEFSDGVRSEVRVADRYLTIHQDDRILVRGTDLFYPAVWQGDAWIAFSKSGGDFRWAKPATWGSARQLKVKPLWPSGDNASRSLVVDGSQLTLRLVPGEAVLVRPA